MQQKRHTYTQESHHLEWSVWDVRKDSAKARFFLWGAAAQRQACWSWGATQLFEAIPYCRPVSSVFSAFISQSNWKDSQMKWIEMVLNVNICQLDVSRYFKISQSFFSTRGATCLSDYCCCWTASTRVGESEKPILSGGRGLYDEIAWNGIKPSCSNSEWDKSVVLPFLSFGSLWFILMICFHLLSGTATERQSRWNPGACWCFLALSLFWNGLPAFQIFPACHSYH